MRYKIEKLNFLFQIIIHDGKGVCIIKAKVVFESVKLNNMLVALGFTVL